MDQERQREIASKGGRAAHAQGSAHEFDAREAREAGRRGGRSVSRDRRHMAEIGARGGHNSHAGRAERVRGVPADQAAPGTPEQPASGLRTPTEPGSTGTQRTEHREAVVLDPEGKAASGNTAEVAEAPGRAEADEAAADDVEAGARDAYGEGRGRASGARQGRA